MSFFEHVFGQRIGMLCSFIFRGLGMVNCILVYLGIIGGGHVSLKDKKL